MAEHVAVPTVFYAYYVKYDYLWSLLYMLIQRLIYITLILSTAFSIITLHVSLSINSVLH